VFAAFSITLENAGTCFANIVSIMAKKADIVDTVFIIAIWLTAISLVILVLFKTKLFH
jgi:hypothetical protein